MRFWWNNSKPIPVPAHDWRDEVIHIYRDQVHMLQTMLNEEKLRNDRLVEAVANKNGSGLVMPNFEIPGQQPEAGKDKVFRNPWKDPNLITGPPVKQKEQNQ